MYSDFYTYHLRLSSPNDSIDLLDEKRQIVYLPPSRLYTGTTPIGTLCYHRGVDNRLNDAFVSSLFLEV